MDSSFLEVKSVINRQLIQGYNVQRDGASVIYIVSNKKK